MSDIHSPCAESTGTGAPEAEIEITPEMIEAGVDELCDRLETLTLERGAIPTAARAIFLAMTEASRTSRPDASETQ